VVLRGAAVCRWCCTNRRTHGGHHGPLEVCNGGVGSVREAMAMSKIKQANSSITKAKDFRNDIANLMQPYASWEQYLAQVPASIELLGQLIRISADDVSLDKTPPVGGYKFIRYPNSFRACLLQVCYAGWEAFNEAHKNMDQIRLYTGQVPHYLRNVVEIIVQGDTQILQAFLPAELQNIKHIASECLTLAEKNEAKFSDVIHLIKELVLALIGTDHDCKKELDEIKENIKAAEAEQKSAEDAKKIAMETFEKVQKELTEAEEDYKQALDSMPTGWKHFGMTLLSAIAEQIPAIAASYFSGLIGLAVQTTVKVGFKIYDEVKASMKDSAGKQDGGAEKQEGASSLYVLAQSALLLNLSVQMGIFCDDKKKINWAEVYDQEKEAAASDFLKKYFEIAKKNISKQSESEFRTEALDICNKGIYICTELAKYAPKKECDDAKTEELVEAIRSLYFDALNFDSKSKAYTNHTPLSVEPPHYSRKQTAGSSGDPYQIYTNQVIARVELTSAMLSRARDEYTAGLENTEKKTKKLNDLIFKIERLTSKELDISTKIQVLAQGLEVMGHLKQQWNKLVELFQFISNIVKTTLTQHLTNFEKTLLTAASLNYTFDEFIMDKIYSNILNASGYAYLVNMISTTYSEVSRNHLMDSVSTLGKLMTMDRTKTEEVKTAMDDFLDQCKKAKESISEIVARNKEDIGLRFQTRIAQIRTVLNAALPPVPEEETQRVKEIVQAGFRAAPREPVGKINPLPEKEADQFV
ncbi:hypothetical protein NFI96_008555, partial [Prochilodus magdalenae]